MEKTNVKVVAGRGFGTLTRIESAIIRDMQNTRYGVKREGYIKPDKNHFKKFSK